MSASHRAPLIASPWLTRTSLLKRTSLLAAIGLAALAGAGCQSRAGLGDTTGSIGRSETQPRTSAEWQAESERWGRLIQARKIVAE